MYHTDGGKFLGTITSMNEVGGGVGPRGILESLIHDNRKRSARYRQLDAGH